jgi:UDP-glucuronate decarboxylase
LLTGGTGFFGKALLRHHLAHGLTVADEITVISRDPQRFLVDFPQFDGCRSIEFVTGDVMDRVSLPWNRSFTHVLHAAAESTFGPRLTPLQRFTLIVDGTRNVLDLAVSTGARRLLLTSSGGVYGPQPADMLALSEEWIGPLDPADVHHAYGHGKRVAEHLCALYADAHGIETVIARCFSFVGPDLPLDVHYAIGNFVRDALTAECITVTGDGSPVRTYLDQIDLASWLMTLLRVGRSGEAYNVGGGDPISLSTVAQMVRDLLAPAKPVRIIGDPSLQAPRHRYVPDIRKIGRECGLTVTVPLPDAIRRMGEAHRQRLGV